MKDWDESVSTRELALKWWMSLDAKKKREYIEQWEKESDDSRTKWQQIMITSSCSTIEAIFNHVHNH